MDPMPGYEITELWMTEDGLPKKGSFFYIYVYILIPLCTNVSKI